MEKDLSYKEMYEKFYKSYYSSIKSFLEILEKERKDELKKHIVNIVIFIISVLVCLALVAIMHINDTCSLWGQFLSSCFKLPKFVRSFIFLMTLAIALFSYVAMQNVLYVYNNFNYCKSLKLRLIPLVLDSMGCIRYLQVGAPGGINPQNFNLSIFEKDLCDERICCDIFKGYRNGVKFEIIEYLNNGVCVGFELNKKLNKEVIIKSKKTSLNRILNIAVLGDAAVMNLIPICFLLIFCICIPTLLTRLISLTIIGCVILFIWSSLVVNKRKTLKSEDLNFNDKYSIYSEDEVEARYLATTTFIDRLMNMELAFNATDIMCSGFEDKLIFVIYTKKDLFELGSLYKRVDTTKYIEEVFNQITSIMLMIDHFKLDEKTGL